MNHLRLLDVEHGKLLNFKAESVQARFVNNAHRWEERQAFSIAGDSSQNDLHFEPLSIDLLRDWGTGLSLPLHQQALCHLLGGETCVESLVQLRRGGVELGEQRFPMYAEGAAFRLTAVPRATPKYGNQLRKLLNHSPLTRITWVNIALGEVTFTTLQR